MSDGVLDAASGASVRQGSLGGTQAVAFDGCFGWLHSPAVGADIAVLLCSGLCSDQLTAYRDFRLLAEDLALAGYPTLRFDYPGTGDSCDVEPDAPLWEVWQRSVHAAADWLRRNTGARRVVLCGLRLSATLAATVAEQRTDVAGLLLLAPILRGRSFLRQMQIEAKLSGSQDVESGLELHGLRLSPAAMRAIAAVELGQVVLPPGCAVSVFSQHPSPALEQCAQEWAGHGVPVMQADFTGLEPMLRPTYMCHEAPAHVGRITDWLCQAVPAVRTAPLLAPPCSVLFRPDRTETPLRFGADKELFGMLCRPEHGSSDWAVIIVNSGGDPRHGLGRAGVDMARRLAAFGIASLRMDFAGLGDSVAPGDAETHVFETSRRADISAAIDVLAGLGHRRFAVHGVCSGAYHAFHAALGDERIGALLLVNLPMFEWQAGEKVEFLTHTQASPLRFVARLRSAEVWRRMLRGELNLRDRLVAQRSWFTARLARLRNRMGFGPPPSFAQRAAHILARRTRTLLLMAENDTGLAALATEFGPSMDMPGGTLHVLPEIDHSLTRTAMRGTVTGLMVGFLRN